MKRNLKSVIAVLLSAVLLFSFAGCKEEEKKNPPEGTEFDEIGTDFEGVNIKITDLKTVDGKTTLSVKWINGTSHKITYGAGYTIEYLENDEWISCLTADKHVVIAIGYELKARKSADKDYVISNLYDISKVGKYRITSDCYVYEDGPSGEGTKCNLWAEFSIYDTESYVKLDFDAQYIRTNGEHNGVEHFIIRSKEELDTYYKQNKNKHNLERRENPASDNTIGFLDACDKYNKKFFEDNVLIMVLLEEGSGSTRHKVTEVSITRPEMSLLAAKVKIDSIVPEVGTCDMAGWHILISVKKENIHKDLDYISIYCDNKLENGEAGYCGNTQTIIHFDKSNKYTFMGDNSVTLTDLLRNLDYEPDRICKCLPEYTVDTEFGTGYGIHLTEGYARYNGGQVDLTKEQVEQITEIINWAKKEANYIAFNTESIKAIQAASAKDNKFCKLKGDDINKVSDIVHMGKLVDGTGNCLSDCILMLGDTKYYYHSSCGTINDSVNNKSLDLDEELKKSLNAILSKYIELEQ